MTKEIKQNTIDNLVAVSYYWIGDENPQCSLNVCKLLMKLEDLTKSQKKKIDDLYHDWKALFSTRYKESEFEIINLPDKYVDDEGKLLFIAVQSIMNLIGATNYEMAFMFLIEMSENWNELYINVVEAVKKSEFKLPFSEWLTMHFMLALDINGKKDMEFAGFKIEKIGDGDIFDI